MTWLNDEALNKIENLRKTDAKYCANLTSRFQKMEITSNVASSAISYMIDEDAIPNGTLAVPTPSLFKKHLLASENEATPQMAVALS